MKKINKKIKLIVVIEIVVLGVTGCAFERDSKVASYNVSKEADNFKVKRRITFINLRHDSYLFEIVGNCSIDDNSSGELEVICKVGEDKYQKHFLKKTTEVTYVVEQLDYSEVSKYDYEIVFKPESIVPIKIETEVGGK
ncbi:MAG: hypothetical protein J6B89_03520 [Bacilli bacterium]|nr:hypothetical protein [Bacilli bacterium]